MTCSQPTSGARTSEHWTRQKRQAAAVLKNARALTPPLNGQARLGLTFTRMSLNDSLRSMDEVDCVFHDADIARAHELRRLTIESGIHDVIEQIDEWLEGR